MKNLSNIMNALMLICLVGIVFYIVGAIITFVFSKGRKLPSLGGGIWIGIPICYFIGMRMGSTQAPQVVMFVILSLLGVSCLAKELGTNNG